MHFALVVCAGFDPFRESTKALQDLMEKESSSSSAAQSPNTHYPMTSGTQSFSHLHTQHAPTSNGGLHDHKLPQPSQARPLPPGFAPNLISNSFNSHFPRTSLLRLVRLEDLGSCSSLCLKTNSYRVHVYLCR